MNKQGKLTPSQFADMMTRDRSGNEFGKTALAYAARVACERLGVQLPEVDTWAMQHGNLNEPLAVEAYEDRTGVIVLQNHAPMQHPTLDYIAGTPDGFINDDGLIEVKCPYNPVNHLANLRTGEQIELYKWQIQGYLWITDRKWCDFVSFHPDFPEPLNLYVQRIERDEMMITELAERAAKFEQIVQSMLEELTQ